MSGVSCLCVVMFSAHIKFHIGVVLSVLYSQAKQEQTDT